MPGAQPLDPCLPQTLVVFSAPTWLGTLTWKSVRNALFYISYDLGYRRGDCRACERSCGDGAVPSNENVR